MNRNKPLIFNPDEEPKDMLIATFVIRQNLFDKIFKVIKESSRTTPPQHFLLVGQRGMGKTTLLLRIKYAIEDDPELADYLMLIRFPEEQYNIGCLPDLWEETALYLENLNPVFEGLSDEFKPHEKKEDYERLCFELLTKKLKQHKKRILFLIDNFGDLLHKFTDLENHRFRELLMTSPYLQLIGASSEMLEHSFEYDKPFFEFFYRLKLEPLNRPESISLMKALAENYDVTEKITTIINQSPERIEVLRRITGGVPRTLVLLFEIFIDHNDGSAFEDLEHLVDKVLPLYKARMDGLKPQQQKIIDALARAWEAIPASDVLEQSKLYRENITSNQVSSQLKQLEDNQLVETVDISKRKKLYRIRERFFNIWYLMRNGRKQNKEQVLWLIRFLESWCTPTELQDIALKQIENLSGGKYSEKAAYYKAMALHSIKCIDAETKQELLKHTEKFLLKTKKQNWANTIHKLIERENDGWIQNFLTVINSGDFETAENLLLKDVAKNKQGAYWNLAMFYDEVKKDFDKAEEFYLKAIKQGNIDALFNLAILYNVVKKDFDKAEEYYLKAIEEGNVEALFNLACLYDTKKDSEKAEEYYLKAIEEGNIEALFNLACLYDTKEDSEKAEEYYLKAIEKENIEALFNLALLYNAKKNYAKAKEYYLLSTKRGVIAAFNNLANLYADVKDDYDKAEEYYLKAIEKGVDFALHNLGYFYTYSRKDYNKAEEYYLKAIEKGVNITLHNLGYFYAYLRKDYDKAEKYYLKAIEEGRTDALYDLAYFYSEVLKDYDKAEEYYLKAVEKGCTNALYNLACLYDNVRKDYDKAEGYYLKSIKNNNIASLHQLAYLYDSIKKNYDKAEEYYLKAIKGGAAEALVNLGNLYADVKKDYDKAERYYLEAIEKGITAGLNNLAILYSEQKNDKEKAEQYFLEALSLNHFEVFENTFKLYWNNNEHSKALNFCSSIFQQKTFFEKETELASQVIITLLAEEQYNFLLNEFKKENSLLMKYLQPMYYVVAWYLKDELPGEYEKTGSEIKETVDEIIKAVEERKAASKTVAV